MSAFTTLLKNRITNELVSYEPNRKTVEDAAVNLVNLNKKPYQTLNNALARTDAVHTVIEAELAGGNLYKWVRRGSRL